MRFLAGDADEKLTPGQVAAHCAALYYLFLGTVPCRQLFIQLEASVGSTVPLSAAVIGSAALCAVLPWAFAAGLSVRATLDRGWRLHGSLPQAGRSLPAVVLVKALEAGILPTIVILPLFMGLCLSRVEGLGSVVALLVLPPCMCCFAAALGLACALVRWPKRLSSAVATRLRFAEALGVTWFVYLFYASNLPMSIISGNLALLRQLSASVAAATPGMSLMVGLLRSCLTGVPTWHGAVVGLGLCFVCLVFLVGYRRFAQQSDPVTTLEPWPVRRAEGPAAQLLVMVIVLVLLRAMFSLPLPTEPRLFLLWSLFVGIVHCLLIAFSSGADWQAALTQSLRTPLRDPRERLFERMSRQLCWSSFYVAVFIGGPFLRGCYGVVHASIAVAMCFVSALAVTVLIRLRTRPRQSSACDPGGAFVAVQPIGLGTALLCQTIVAIMALLAGCGYYAWYLPGGPLVVRYVWLVLFALGLSGCLFFAVFFPVVVMAQRRGDDRPFAPVERGLFS